MGNVSKRNDEAKWTSYNDNNDNDNNDIDNEINNDNNNDDNNNNNDDDDDDDDDDDNDNNIVETHGPKIKKENEQSGVHLNKRLNKQWSWRWFVTPWPSCDVIMIILKKDTILKHLQIDEHPLINAFISFAFTDMLNASKVLWRCSRKIIDYSNILENIPVIVNKKSSKPFRIVLENQTFFDRIFPCYIPSWNK